MYRWWVIPRNGLFNIYLHNTVANDEDRALHDHPWWNMSVVLRGGYWEVIPFTSGIRGSVSADLPYTQRRVWRGPGSIVIRPPTGAHRLEVGPKGSSWSLFITLRRVRTWGFLCPNGWVDWQTFTGASDHMESGTVKGRGCGEQ
jgi:hypothetical protein